MYDFSYVSLFEIAVFVMSRGRLSSLIALMVVLQLFTAVAESHAFEQFESTPSSHDTLHQVTADMHAADDHSDSDGHENAADHVRHCSHHGCHCPLLMSGSGAHSFAKSLSTLKDRSLDRIPDAPISALYRPPIA